jgi:hypothetical protein
MGSLQKQHAAAVALGGVHRAVGGVDHRFAVGAVPREQGNADAAADVDLHVRAGDGRVDVVRFEHGGGDLLDAPFDGHGVVDIEDNREFVAAEARGGFFVAQVRAQAVGDELEQLVAGGVPVVVVDRLEAVDVEIGECEAAVGCARPRDRRLQTRDEQQAVADAGEHVVMREVAHLFLRGAALGDFAFELAVAFGQVRQRIAQRALAAVKIEEHAHLGQAGSRR